MKIRRTPLTSLCFKDHSLSVCLALFYTKDRLVDLIIPFLIALPRFCHINIDVIGCFIYALAEVRTSWISLRSI